MDAIADSQHWLEQAVIGLNLCPFAKAVHGKRQIRWVESAATQPRQLLDELVAELEALDAADPELVDTTLLVCPQVLQDFLDFNDFLDVADGLIEDLGLEGRLQIAGFHPQFQFEGTDPDDPGNYSNRSPHPTLHLLREASLDRAVAAFPEAEAIYERNIETLRGLTPAQWHAAFGAHAPQAGGSGSGSGSGNDNGGG
ncbi:MAG: DUF1415 domain-containing protein [Leptothrix sp. (in: Bacteria)]|nr:DUF1415 domain-containing protein [Leptothrix sp. (in: b-proteobacteria)]